VEVEVDAMNSGADTVFHILLDAWLCVCLTNDWRWVARYIFKHTCGCVAVDAGVDDLIWDHLGPIL
jgi:hypothetical protein